MIEVTRGELIRHAWQNGILDWKLDSLQKQITQAVNSNPKAHRICILSSRQIGKSYWDVIYALKFLIKNPGRTARIAAPSRSNCSDIVNDNLARIIEDCPEGMVSRRHSGYRWHINHTSTLRMVSMERAHVDKMARGGNASLIIYEECGFVKPDDFTYAVDSVLGPQLTRSQEGGIEIFVSTPPVDPHHPLITKIKPECEEMGTFFSYTIFDSPSITANQIFMNAERSGSLFTPPLKKLIEERKITRHNFYEHAHATGSIVTESFRREYLAEIFRSEMTTVVPHFDSHKHVQEIRPPSNCRWTITIDWGGVRDFTVALLHTYDYFSERHVIWREMMFRNNTETKKIIDSVKLWRDEYRIETTWADVPGQIQTDLLNTYNYPVAIPPKGDWLASVSSMASQFTLDKVVIHPSCKFLIRSISSGSFNRNRTDFDRTEELGHMDGLAALMYAFKTQNKENPYAQDDNRHHHNVFIPQKAEADTLPEDIGDVSGLSTKTFGNFRRR